MRILLVEDNPADADLQRRALERQVPGAEVHLAASLAEARDALAGNEAFDCVVEDLRLPDGSGLELIGELNTAGRGEAVLVLTGHGEQESVVAAFRAGADDYLTKSDDYLERLPGRVVDARARRELRVIDAHEPLRVLYAEHNEFDIGLTRRELAHAAPHIHLQAVHTAEEALAALPQKAGADPGFDLLLVDYRLPGIDGLELARLVREERGLDLPTVLVTGQGTEDLAARALRMGVEDYAVKRDGYLKMLPVLLDQVHARARLRRERAALAASERRYREVIERAGDIVFETDAAGCWRFLNPAWTAITGHSVEAAIGGEMLSFIPLEDRGMVARLLARAAEADDGRMETEIRLRAADGSLRWLELRGHINLDAAGRAQGLSGSLVDVTRRVLDQRIQEVRVNVLARLATGERDPRLLEDVVKGLESLAPELHGCLMLLDGDSQELYAVTAPRVPDPLRSATRRIRAEQSMGSCGEAAWSGEPVVVEDCRSHPNWAGYCDLTHAAGFHACWSFPFHDADGSVLGTLGIYVAAARGPNAGERVLIEEFTQIAGLAVQKLRAAQALGERERALRTAAELTVELLREDNPASVIHRLLAELGQETHADRAYVLVAELDHDVREALDVHRYYWVRTDTDYAIRPPPLRNLSLESLLPRWHAILQDGGAVDVLTRDLPDAERELMEAAQCQAALLVPLYVEGEYRGFLALDRVQRAQRWSDADQSLARIVASSLGAALERRQALLGLRRMAAVFESTRDGIVITDLTPRIVAVNPAFADITGFSEAEVMGRNPSFLQSGRHDADFFKRMWDGLEREGHWQGEIWNRRRNGEVAPQWLSLNTVNDEQGQALHYAGVLTDMSELRRSEDELQYLAQHDALTDLPNRSQLQAMLGQALERARTDGYRIAVLSLDLDRFKNVNDSMGHPVGDQVLVEVARRLREAVGPAHALGRLGGDEFLVVAENPPSDEAVARCARDLLASLERPFALEDGRLVYLNGSIGISLYPEHGDSVTALIQHADAAMYQAKASGRQTWSVYTQALTRAADERLELENRLRHAVETESGELRLHFQPQVALEDGRPFGMEALLRWQTEDGEMIPPDRFIPIAEDTGLIVALGEWVLREACDAGRTLLDRGAGDFSLAVNLSPVQLQRGDFVNRVAEILALTGFPAEQLELEITETAIMQQGEQAIARLVALKELGVRLAIDDFGTGYSSLAALRTYPLDVLKIDRSFVDGVASESADREIAATIIAMGRNLNMQVIAEGVETAEQAAFLRERGCALGQGYFYSRPLELGALADWMTRHGALTSG
ncbi:EAL domain-containing protein [Thioalkalivibrio sp. AKL19]|uniref:EAL domain-containing protein n=1 Tax=Thioalkalivibrio sp. AKL19 TaxID=1266914 RepID=UPI0004085F47|nr:EAL domain-containing protein [Thioalkalivibrio sp. AKL19]